MDTKWYLVQIWTTDLPLSLFLSSFLSQNASDMPETITGRDAARFPIIASCTLFGLYLFFKVTRALLFSTSDTLKHLISPCLCVCVCVAGVFSRVHQPAAVGLLLRPGRPRSVSHHEVRPLDSVLQVHAVGMSTVNVSPCFSCFSQSSDVQSLPGHVPKQTVPAALHSGLWRIQRR